MKRTHLLLAVLASAIIGGAVASVVFSPSKSKSKGVTPDYSEYADFSFTSNSDSSNTPPIIPDFTTAAERGVKSVVNVDVVQRIPIQRRQRMDIFDYFFGRPYEEEEPNSEKEQPEFFERNGGGSGVIISEDGYIVTNNHVVQGADEIKIRTHDEGFYIAEVIGTDPATDVALLKIDAKGLQPIEFGDSDALRLGEWVLAIGNPYGLSSTVTQGIISAKGRSVGAMAGSQLEIASFIQTDAVVNSGNSGGALITLNGKLIGINTLIYSPTGSYSGYSFAIPSAIVRKVVTDIMEHGVAQRALLGISMGEITAEWLEKFGEETGIKEPGGIYVGEVQEESAAEAAGIKKGDVLISINGVKMNRASQVQETIARLRPNDKISVAIKRDGKVKHLDVVLRNKAGGTDIVTKKDFNIAIELGGQFRNVDNMLQEKLKIDGGVQVTFVNPKGLLARCRIEKGFIITHINSVKIKNLRHFESLSIDKIEDITGVYPNGSKTTYVLPSTN